MQYWKYLEECLYYMREKDIKLVCALTCCLVKWFAVYAYMLGGLVFLSCVFGMGVTQRMVARGLW